MSYQLTKILLTALFVALSTQAWANELVAKPVTLRGYQNSHSVFLKTEGTTTDVKLRFDRSDAVLADESFVTVSLNDRPLRTIAMSEIGSSLDLTLETTSAGFHKMSIDTLLVVDEERCTPAYDQLAWVVLRNDSEVSSDVSAKRKSLNERLTALTIVDAQRLGFNNAESLEIEIGLERFLTNSNIARATETDTRFTKLVIAKPTVELRTLFPSVLGTDLPEHDVALLSLDDRLLLVGESKPVSRVLSNLHKNAKLCTNERSCFWRPTDTADATEEKTSDANSTVWNLRDVSPNGWSFSGDSGTAGFQWEKPKTWTVVKTPQMQFEAFQHRPFELVVYLNDQPIERFSPTAKHSNIAVSIPKRFWEEDTWDFRFDFKQTEETDACVAAQKFAHMSPTAALIVPRKEALYASFGSSFDADVSVMIATEIDPVRAAQVIAPALTKVARVKVVDNCTTNCIRLVSPTYFEERYAVALINGRGSSNVPVLDPTNILLAERGGTVWNLHVGQQAPMDSHRLFLRTDDVVMMSGGAWATIKASSERTEFITVAPKYTDKRSVVGKTGVSARIVNLLTVLAIITLVIGSAIYLWRTKDPSESLFE